MSGELWAFVFLFVILKIPVGAALYLVWWSSRSSGDPTADGADPGGGFRDPRHPRPRRPRPPRRGPHGSPSPGSPPRVRVHHGRPAHSHG